jgi:hypothetical protein
VDARDELEVHGDGAIVDRHAVLEVVELQSQPLDGLQGVALLAAGDLAVADLVRLGPLGGFELLVLLLDDLQLHLVAGEHVVELGQELTGVVRALIRFARLIGDEAAAEELLQALIQAHARNPSVGTGCAAECGARPRP